MLRCGCVIKETWSRKFGVVHGAWWSGTKFTANLRALYKLAEGNRQHSHQQTASQHNFVPVLWNRPNAATMLGGAEADDDLSLPKGMLLARFLIHCTQKLTCA